MSNGLAAADLTQARPRNAAETAARDDRRRAELDRPHTDHGLTPGEQSRSAHDDAKTGIEMDQRDGLDARFGAFQQLSDAPAVAGASEPHPDR